MKPITILLFSILTTTLLACNNTPKQAPVISQPEPEQQHFDCNVLTDKSVVLDIADSIINAGGNDGVWNLRDLDTLDYFTTEDYFTNTQTKNRLVLINGQSGGSSGSSHYLLILFSCTDSIHVVWAEQLGSFTADDIKDLNGDGIKEITCNEGTIWMGESHNIYSIFNFKGGKHNLLYEAHSISYLDAGNDNLNEIYNPGDTLATEFQSTLLKKNDKQYYIHQLHTVKLHNGGKTEEDLIKNLNVVTDSSDINL